MSVQSSFFGTYWLDLDSGLNGATAKTAYYAFDIGMKSKIKHLHTRGSTYWIHAVYNPDTLDLDARESMLRKHHLYWSFISTADAIDIDEFMDEMIAHFEREEGSESSTKSSSIQNRIDIEMFIGYTASTLMMFTFCCLLGFCSYWIIKIVVEIFNKYQIKMYSSIRDENSV